MPIVDPPQIYPTARRRPYRARSRTPGLVAGHHYIARVVAIGSDLTGLDTIDGYALTDGDPVLCPVQSSPQEQGLYAARSGAWDKLETVRSGDVVTILDDGDTYQGTTWQAVAESWSADVQTVTYRHIAGAVVLASSTSLTPPVAADVTILCGATITVSLPAPRRGQVVRVVSTGAYTVTVDTVDSATINGSASITVTATRGAVTLQSDGTDWYIVAVG